MSSKLKKQISKTKLSWLANKKTNPELRKTILLLKKQKNEFWHYIAKLLARPRRKNIEINLDKINKLGKENSIILVAGKILGKGSLNKKLKISSFKISEKAKSKIEESGSSYIELKELIKKNPNTEEIKLII